MSEIFSNIFYIIIALLVFALLIFVHELGHYTFGKIFKFKINEFSIGFGKEIWKKTRKNGEVFAIRMIPLGGYCAFEGEDETTDNPDSFNKKVWWQRLIVLFGGAFFNFLAAVIAAVALLMVMGDGLTAAYSFDADYQTHISTLSETEYFKERDIFLEINNVKPSYLNGGAFSLMSKQEVGSPYTVKVLRDKQVVELTITNYKTVQRNNVEYASAGLHQEAYVSYSLGTSLLKSVPFCAEISWECLKIVGNLIVGKQSIQNLGGPVTAVSAVAQAAVISFRYLLLFFTILSLNLAVFNLLPIPALDGARMAFVIIEGVRGKPINEKIEQRIHTIGLIVLLSFIVLVDFLQIFVFRLL